MELTFSCPACGAVGQVPRLEMADRAVCRRCGTEKPLYPGAIDHSQLVACPFCDTADLYAQKDFPQALGLAIVIVQFAISTVFWYYEMPIATYSVLIASALLDWALYPRVPDVTICYRCSCQVRGEGSNPDKRFQLFDLAIGERYRQERIRAKSCASRERRPARRSPELDHRGAVAAVRPGMEPSSGWPGVPGFCDLRPGGRIEWTRSPDDEVRSPTWTSAGLESLTTSGVRWMGSSISSHSIEPRTPTMPASTRSIRSASSSPGVRPTS